MGPFGSNGLSECFFGGEHNAFLSGIYDATGVRIYEMPAYAAKVKEGLDKLSAGEAIESKHYFFGNDFYDELDYQVNHPVPDDWLQKLMTNLMAATAPAPKAEEKKEVSKAKDDDVSGIVEL